MAENVFEELKRYINWNEEDEAALRALHPILAPDFEQISVVFYDRILQHDEARKALVGGESSVGRLKVTLVAWMDRMLRGPWDNEYFELRCRIGRVHVRIKLDQHYMFGAMNVIRREMNDRIDRALIAEPAMLARARKALGKIIDLELAIMLHTYREDLLAQQSRIERLSTFGQLVGSIGHELRNPLGVIETSLFILKNRTQADERATKHVGRIAEQLVIANSIITDLLDMIREKPLTRERLALAQVIEAAAAAVHRPEKVDLQLDGLMDVPEVEGDASQLRQVFVNLIDNAVHAAGVEGSVAVKAYSQDGRVCVSVEDTGSGIDPSILGRLFEPLVTTKAKGIGLGLALVKRIVERHQGTISYEPQGKGARFVVRLPRAG